MRRPAFRHAAPLLALALLAALPDRAPAQAGECDRSYTVRRGDTLSLIATRLLGNAQYYQLIYIANAAQIGPDPANIEVGQTLAIPCPDRPLSPADTPAGE